MPAGHSSPVDYEQVRLDFFESHLGSHDMVYHPPLGLPHVDVYRFPPSGERGYWCYVTNGMSDFPLILPDGDRYRIELMAATTREAAAFAELLRRLGEYPFAAGTFLIPNHTITAPSGLLDEHLTSLLFTPPFLLPAAQAFNMGPHTVHTASVIGITAAELDHAKRRSSSDLIHCLPDQLSTWLLDGRCRNH